MIFSKDERTAVKLVKAYFRGKTILMRDPKHEVPDWVSIKDPNYWNYLTEFCKNVDKYRILD